MNFRFSFSDPELKIITKMISVVISTHKPDLLQQISKNIEQTIGVAYEIIAIENDARFSISEAYNSGVEKAQYPFLCFVHEDVLFQTNGWGEHLVNIMMNDKKVGLIGIAGTKFKSSYPSAWGQSPYLSKYRCGHIVQRFKNDEEKYIDFNGRSEYKGTEEVMCVDGVFLFTKKEIFKTCRFDNVMLTGFHGYDIDFSLQVHFQSYKVIVSRGVLLLHFSAGNYTRENTIANRKISFKWRKKLPAATVDTHLSTLGIMKSEIMNWIFFLTTALKRLLKFKSN